VRRTTTQHRDPQSPRRFTAGRVAVVTSTLAVSFLVAVEYRDLYPDSSALSPIVGIIAALAHLAVLRTSQSRGLLTPQQPPEAATRPNTDPAPERQGVKSTYQRVSINLQAGITHTHTGCDLPWHEVTQDIQEGQTVINVPSAPALSETAQQHPLKTQCLAAPQSDDPEQTI